MCLNILGITIMMHVKEKESEQNCKENPTLYHLAMKS